MKKAFAAIAVWFFLVFMAKSAQHVSTDAEIHVKSKEGIFQGKYIGGSGWVLPESEAEKQDMLVVIEVYCEDDEGWWWTQVVGVESCVYQPFWGWSVWVHPMSQVDSMALGTIRLTFISGGQTVGSTGWFGITYRIIEMIP
jgi:hypothetical protein